MRFAPFKTLVLGFESRSTQLLILNPASPGKQRKKPLGRIRTVQDISVTAGASRCGKPYESSFLPTIIFFAGPRTSQFEQVGECVSTSHWDFGTAILEGQPRDEAASGDAPP
jgi:hypothetical protein